MAVVTELQRAERARDAAIAEEESAREAHVAATEKVRITTEALDALRPAPPAASPATPPTLQLRASGSAAPAAPAPFVQPCSCLKCWEGQHHDGARLLLRRGRVHEGACE